MGRAYVVRRPRPSALVSFLLTAGVLTVFVTRFDFSRPIFALVLLVALGALYRDTQVLRVDEKGVRMRPAFVPWSSIDSVVADGEQIGVRLRRDAPLPEGVRGVIHDPAGTPQVPPALRRRVRRLDHDALAAAVAAFGGGARLDYDLNRR
jgi:hypothetical protein